MMSGVIEISDDSNDSIEKSAPDVFAVVGTSDEDSPEQDSRHDYKPVFCTQSDNGASSSMNQKKQMLIKHLFPSVKEVKSANFVKHEKPSFLHEMMIRGVSVKMPIKPYGCQIALMSTLITAISKSENCILESPTGTGKTLALLCAALAWQQQEQNRFNQAQVQLAEALRNPNGGDIYSTPVKKFQDLRTSSSTPEKLFSKPIYGEKSIYDPIPNSAEGGDLNMKRKWEEWESPPENRKPGLVTIHKKINTGAIDLTQGYPPSSSNMSSTPKKTSQETEQNILQKNIKIETIDLTPGHGPLSSSSMSSTPEKTNEETTQNRRVPIIFYGTRTHKQLEQVIKEFKRTHYCGQIKMTILSSREHSCIRQFDRSQWATKDDMCRACVKKQQTVLNDEKVRSNCTYYENRAALNHGTLPPAFNLEELVVMGDELVACPYYAARQMAAKAEIVFCPYNYIIEPGIRKSMNINLSDNILIIDEAHNIEDVCREAATFIIHVEQIAAALKELEIASMYRYASKGADTYMDILKKALDKWQYWFENQRPLVETQPVKMGKATFTWQDVKVFAKTLDDHNIGRANYSEFSQKAQQFCRQFNEDPRSLIGVSQSTCNLMETIDTILGYLFQNSGEAMDDFAPVLFLKPAQNRKGRDMLGLHMICLNPGVVFGGLRSTRCVALASGTLSPRGALAAELGAPFPHAVSPPHVVPPERVWIGVVRTGSNSTSLQLTWQGTQQASVRDALGDTILRACRVTPHGVLCFMPSYRLMNDLHTRWQQTGLWHNLLETKHVFMESQNVSEHNDVMEEFYEKVVTEKGAILFGVFRGKAAEGMDFRDRQARLVIAVGIPYPNVEDPAVKEKKKYNDRHESRGLLRGPEWYSTQAYRALNQALGRCIRHRADWGGALLLDARYAQAPHTAHLPAWLRTQVIKKTPYTYDGLVQEDDGLQMFMENMTLNDQEDI